jgi:hypothetical protein
MSDQTKHVCVLCEGNALLLNADAGSIPLPYMGEVQKKGNAVIYCTQSLALCYSSCYTLHT